MSSLERSVWWGDNPENQLERVQDLVKLLESQWPLVRPDNQLFAAIGNTHAFLSQNLWLLGREAQAVEQLRISTWYDRWDYRLRTLGESQLVELPLVGADRKVVLGRPPEIQTFASIWLGRLFQAAAVRDWAHVEALLDYRFEPETTSSQPGRATNAEAAMWKAFFRADRSTAERLAEYGELAAGEGDLGLCKVGLVWSIITSDHDQFKQEVVNCHHAYVQALTDVEADGMRDQFQGAMLNQMIVTVISMAVQAGFPPPPQSPYFPDLARFLDHAEPIAPEYEPDQSGRYPSAVSGPSE